MGATALAAANLNHTYPARGRGPALPVLDDVSVAVGQGEVVAILGPSGCGKSTLLNLLAGLLTPDTGSVLLNGRDIAGISGHLAYMMQDDLLLPWRTVLDNVVLGPELARSGRRAARERALGLMPTFGLAGFENYFPHALSGGMRQRAAFMRTVLCDRDVILLDEPFAGIDALTRNALHEWFLGLCEQFDLTTLVITHDPEEAVFLADRIYILSPRPTSVRAVVEIDLPRPRHREIVTSAEFARLKGEVLRPLWADLADPVATEVR
ncbi:ABC transporter ATP-binding protein [Amycolatopsis sp. NBC_01307]|uniref:ABC transporter ATP-binding protein n=1 Tax=Amycolatopsis sp. NBC_01307 TaxID=2903561 RepID=UPI002E0DDF5D|nr:ABC transporter ATP-binding protein [Amycolatopsis sp. NBC_01307]